MDHAITDGALTAVINAHGAELASLRNARGTEYIWQAGPAWPRHAPVLFPIVGRLAGDQLRHGGQAYRLTQHGFARDRVFAWLDRGARSCRLALVDDAETRALYPFPFRFEIAYALAGGELAMTFTVVNAGAETLPVSFGAHPAFNWPLDPAIPREAYALTFAKDEPAPIRRLSGGLILREPFPSPIEGRVLKLREDSVRRRRHCHGSRRERLGPFRGAGRPRPRRRLAGLPRAWPLDQARRRLSLHRALARRREPGRFRWTLRRKAGHYFAAARRNPPGDIAHRSIPVAVRPPI